MRRALEDKLFGTFAKENDDLKDNYIIWCPGATQPPRYRYPDKGAAIRAAYAMAGKNPGKQFAVCKIEGVSKVSTVTFEDFSK